MSSSTNPATTAPETTGPGAVPIPAEEREIFRAFPGTDAEMFIQWKGTDVCLDFHCPCQPVEAAFSSHFDGYGAYYVRCTECGAVYELGTQVLARRVDSLADIAAVDLVLDEVPSC